MNLWESTTALLWMVLDLIIERITNPYEYPLFWQTIIICMAINSAAENIIDAIKGAERKKCTQKKDCEDDIW